METHIKVLGILYIICNVLGILCGIGLLVLLSGIGLISGDPDALFILTLIGSILAFLLIIFSVPGVVGGIALLKRYPWSRILVLVLGILNLINIPFGTVLGIYTIWVLAQDEAAKYLAPQ